MKRSALLSHFFSLLGRPGRKGIPGVTLPPSTYVRRDGDPGYPGGNGADGSAGESGQPGIPGRPGKYWSHPVQKCWRQIFQKNIFKSNKKLMSTFSHRLIVFLLVMELLFGCYLAVT